MGWSTGWTFRVLLGGPRDWLAPSPRYKCGIEFPKNQNQRKNPFIIDFGGTEGARETMQKKGVNIFRHTLHRGISIQKSWNYDVRSPRHDKTLALWVQQSNVMTPLVCLSDFAKELVHHVTSRINGQAFKDTPLDRVNSTK